MMNSLLFVKIRGKPKSVTILRNEEIAFRI
jgi:hypothetical protein